MKKFIENKIVEHIDVMKNLVESQEVLNSIYESTNAIINAYKYGNKLLLCGNGGSAADSQHIATELVSRFLKERRALDAEALTVNTSTLTAVANDYSYDKIFSRQVEAKGQEGDILIGISTSGNSKNVIEAIKTAKEIDMITIGLIGDSKGSLIYKLSDYCICIPTNATPRIQEAHILIGHIMCELIEIELFKNQPYNAKI